VGHIVGDEHVQNVLQQRAFQPRHPRLGYVESN
jgi:hypothetical protein